MPLLSPVEYHLGLLEADIRKAGRRRFPPDHADAHVINALLFVRRTRAIERLAAEARGAARRLAELAADGVEEVALRAPRGAALEALDALRDALEDAAPSEHARARGVRS